MSSAMICLTALIFFFIGFGAGCVLTSIDKEISAKDWLKFNNPELYESIYGKGKKK